MLKRKITAYIIILMFSFLNKSVSDNTKSIFDFKIRSINGDELNLADFKNQPLLIVNVASNCGFTSQYDGLQKLFDDYNEKGLVVIGVPSNQFGNQEPGSENEIKNFCESNFNITFPMTSKYDVKGSNAHPI